MIERTYDVTYIRSIVTHPLIFGSVVDEGEPQTWQPNMDAHVAWLRAPGAIFMGYPLTPVLWECHSAVLPEYRQCTRTYYAQAIQWLRDNTTCRHMIGMIAESNWLAKVAARAAGMKREGYLPRSKMRNGVLVGTYIFGIEV